MGKDVKWSILALFVVLSPLIGILIDVCVLFPPSADAHGHGVPVFTILMPLFAIFVVIVAAVIDLTALIVNKSKGESSGRKNYEYLRISQRCNGMQTPALILHEIDQNAGRCSVRCIYIYQDGYMDKFVNGGVYMPVSTAESFQSSVAVGFQTAYIITEREFEKVWNSRHYTGPWAI